MKVSREVVIILEDLLFDYERQAALIEVLHTLVSEKVVEVAGVPENTSDYSLYEILNRLEETNKKFGKLVKESEVIKEK